MPAMLQLIDCTRLHRAPPRVELILVNPWLDVWCSQVQLALQAWSGSWPAPASLKPDGGGHGPRIYLVAGTGGRRP